MLACMSAPLQTTVPQYVQVPAQFQTGTVVAQQPYSPQPVYQQPYYPQRAPKQYGWLLPLLLLLGLSAIGGTIGLFLHNQRAATQLETGQCLNNLANIPGNNMAGLLANRVDCRGLHEGEIVAVINPPAGMTEEMIGTWPQETCEFRFADYVGIDVADSTFDLRAFPVFTTPDNIAGADALHQAIDNGEWKLVCLAQAQDGASMTGSVRRARY
jgi:hypothetical protein